MQPVVTNISTNVLGRSITNTTLTIYNPTSATKAALSEPSNSIVGSLPPLSIPRLNFYTLILPPQSYVSMTELNKYNKKRAYYELIDVKNGG